MNATIKGDDFVTTEDKIFGLGNIIFGTSVANFHSLINQSTLDYKPTRKQLRKISQELRDCADTFCALTDEVNCNILLKQIEKIPKEKIIDGETPALSNTIELFYREKGKHGYNIPAIGVAMINRRDIEDAIFALKTIKVRNLNPQIKRLTNLLADLEKHGKPVNCDNCGQKMNCEGELCHNLCIDCLKKIVAKRFPNYKCPVCNKPLSKRVFSELIQRHGKK